MFHSFVHTHTYSLSLSLSLSYARTHLLVCVNCAYFASIFVYFSMHIQFFFFICLDIHFFASIGTYFFHLLLLLLPLTTRVNTRTLTETPIKKNYEQNNNREKSLGFSLCLAVAYVFSRCFFLQYSTLMSVCLLLIFYFAYSLHLQITQ